MGQPYLLSEVTFPQHDFNIAHFSDTVLWPKLCYLVVITLRIYPVFSLGLPLFFILSFLSLVCCHFSSHLKLISNTTSFEKAFAGHPRNVPLTIISNS